jgi:hypothetical protein
MRPVRNNHRHLSRSLRLASMFFALTFICLMAFGANATPARINVFEAKVLAEPVEGAQVLHVFLEDQKVSVSEETKDGWRRVRIPGGKVGWLSEGAIEVIQKSETTSNETEGESLEALSPSAKPNSVKPLVYVKNLKHLAELTSSDPVVGPMAQKLEVRRVTGFGVAIGGGVGGIAATVLALTVLQSKACIDGPYPDSAQACNSGPNATLLLGGVAVTSVSTIVGLLLLPDREDLLDLLNHWNARHTQDPFTISGEVGNTR